MDRITVHSRVQARHPDISEQDVVAAWSSSIARARRERSERDLYVAIGFDTNGRLLEMVAAEKNGDYLIFHTKTPPTKKTLTELGLLGR
jgi:hypothetical protein